MPVLLVLRQANKLRILNVVIAINTATNTRIRCINYTYLHILGVFWGWWWYELNGLFHFANNVQLKEIGCYQFLNSQYMRLLNYN